MEYYSLRLSGFETRLICGKTGVHIQYFNTISDLDVNQIWHRIGVTLALDSISQQQAGHHAEPSRCKGTDGWLSGGRTLQQRKRMAFSEFQNAFRLFRRSRSLYYTGPTLHTTILPISVS
jgi:hypothetical protein